MEQTMISNPIETTNPVGIQTKSKASLGHRRSRTSPPRPWDIFSGNAHDRLDGPNAYTKNGLRIRIANDRYSRERAFALGYQQYRNKHFLSAHSKNLMLDAFDAQPDTVVFILEDSQLRTLATVTLVMDGAQGLPCDATFRDFVDVERKKGQRMAEATRFAVSCSEHFGVAIKGAINKVMLNVLFLYARRVAMIQNFMIEVNPRHVPFYRRHMLFEPCGAFRSCERVKGAPAVLMRLDTALQQRAIEVVAGSHAGTTGPFARTLYRNFLPLEVEAQWGRDLAAQHQPMSPSEADYFELTHAFKALAADPIISR